MTEEVSGMRCRVMQRLVSTLQGQPLSSGSKLAMVNLEDRKVSGLKDLAGAEMEQYQEDELESEEEDDNIEKRKMEAEDILESWFGKRKVDENYLKTRKIYKSIDENEN